MLLKTTKTVPKKKKKEERESFSGPLSYKVKAHTVPVEVWSCVELWDSQDKNLFVFEGLQL